MSIEILITKNIEAINELITAVYALTNAIEKAQSEVAQNTDSGREVSGEHGPIQPPDPAVELDPVEIPDQDDVRIKYEDVAALLTKVANTHGKQKALSVLAAFELKKLSDAKEIQYPNIYMMLEDLY